MLTSEQLCCLGHPENVQWTFEGRAPMVRSENFEQIYAMHLCCMIWAKRWNEVKPGLSAMPTAEMPSKRGFGVSPSYALLPFIPTFEA